MKYFLCSDFFGVNVDSDVLLRAVGAAHMHLRGFDAIRDSPMKTQVGCKGCHGPMDSGAAFLEGLTTSLFGNYSTGKTGQSKLFVKGADDYRGDGTGFGGLAKLFVGQPEYGACAVKRIFTSVMHREPVPAEASKMALMTEDFNAHGRDWSRSLRTFFVNDVFVKGDLP